MTAFHCRAKMWVMLRVLRRFGSRSSKSGGAPGHRRTPRTQASLAHVFSMTGLVRPATPKLDAGSPALDGRAMLPISGETFPATADELAAALRRGFEADGMKPRAITAEGGVPQMTRLSVDLTGAQLTRNEMPRSVEGGGSTILSAEQFEMFAEPLYFEKAPIEARLEGKGVQAQVTGVPQKGSLILKHAASGTVSVKVAIEALEGLLQSLASEAGGKQGIDIKKTQLTLTQEGPRAVAFRAEVTAKVFIMSATLALTGKLEIDDAFNARLSSLGLDGDAMVTNLAGGFLKPRLQQLEGRVFPLLAILPSGLQLRDIQVAVAPALQVQARFGE